MYAIISDINWVEDYNALTLPDSFLIMFTMKINTSRITIR